jgi:hypothetical protein
MKDSTLHQDHENDSDQDHEKLPIFVNSLPASSLVEPIFLSRFEMKMKSKESSMEYLDSVISFDLSRNKLSLLCNVNATELNTFTQKMAEMDCCEISYHTPPGVITDQLIGRIEFADLFMKGDYTSHDLLQIRFDYSMNLLSVDQQTGVMINS